MIFFNQCISGFDKVFSTDQCRKITSKRMTLEVCLKWCKHTKSCNAVNHDNKTMCVWWACPDPVPEPLLKMQNFKGYIINKKKAKSVRGKNLSVSSS